MKFKTIKLEKNRNKIIIGIVSIIICIVIAIIIKTSFAYQNDYLKSQTVEGLTFENANINYKEGISTFTAEIYNDTEQEYMLRNIEIEIKKKNEEQVVLKGYIGEILDVNEKRELKVSVDEDLTEIVEVKYKINR